MAVLSPQHLLEQAEMLISPSGQGPPKQVYVRRAVSSAYYAVFHALLTALADDFVGRSKRGTVEYALAYRSLSHRTAKNLCGEVQRTTPSKKFSNLVPGGGFGADLVAFSAAFVELQEKRHTADYDPVPRLKTADASLAIKTARSAIRRLHAVPTAKRKRFLALLAFVPRGSED